MWLDDETENGAIVTVSNGTSLGFSLYKNHLIVRNEAGASVTNTNLAVADNAGSNDSDIASVYTMSGTELTLVSPNTLFIPSGSTFAPGNDVTVNNVRIRGTFSMGANPVTVTGAWDAAGGTVTGTNTVTFASGDTHVITPGGNAFANVDFVVPEGDTPQWTTSGALAVTGTQTVRTDDGTIDTTAPTISTASASTVFDTVAIVTWTTNESATAKVVYGTSSGALTQTVSGASLNLTHSLRETGLTSATLYYFKVVARDAAGNTATGSLMSFTTQEALSTASTVSDATDDAEAEGYTEGYAAGYAHGFDQGSTATSDNSGGGGGGGSSGGGRRVRIVDESSCKESRDGKELILEDLSVSVDGKRITVTWKTNDAGSTLIQFGVKTVGELGVVDVRSTENHSIAFDAPEPNTTYQLRGITINACGEIVQSEETEFQTGHGAAPQESARSAREERLHAAAQQELEEMRLLAKNIEEISAQYATPITELIAQVQSAALQPQILHYRITPTVENAARIEWTTNVDTDTRLTITPYYNGQPLHGEAQSLRDKRISRTHSMSVQDIDPRALYAIEMSGEDRNNTIVTMFVPQIALGNDSPSSIDAMFTVETTTSLLPDKSGVLATITWKTPHLTKGVVHYGEGISAGSSSVQQSSATTEDFRRSHTVVLKPLVEGAVYSFRIEGSDSAGAVTSSNLFTLLTPRREENIFDLIAKEMGSLFSWTSNIRFDSSPQ
jgi:hypothetical protein